MMLSGNTLILPIPPERWPPPRADVAIDGLVLEPKPELHVTLIGNTLGCELREVFAEACLTGALDDAFSSQRWDFSRTGRHLLLRKPLNEEGQPGIAHSIIELVELPAMAPFHHALGRLLGRQLPVPPPHVTLHTAGRDSGIGVANCRRLRALTLRPVSATELETTQAPAA
ncbi:MULTISPECIES: hypothetical protein [unclassified Lysobacter]